VKSILQTMPYGRWLDSMYKQPKHFTGFRNIAHKTTLARQTWEITENQLTGCEILPKRNKIKANAGLDPLGM